MLTFNCDSLFNKSRQFIGKSTAARNAGQLADCQLWAANALELLAKSTLANINTALVAVPQNDESLLAACGISVGSSQKNYKTINSKTAYKRIHRLCPSSGAFDYEFCSDIAERRSAELHSGETPYADMTLDEWLPKYWSACKVLLALQKKTLLDWLDSAEAKMAEDVIDERITALQHSVEAKIKSSQHRFEDQYPEGSIRRESLQQLEQRKEKEAPILKFYTGDTAWAFPYKGVAGRGTIKPEECPACGCQGELAYKPIHDEPMEVEPYQRMLVTVTPYQPLGFRCEICGLQLNGSEELEAAGVETEGGEVATVFPNLSRLPQ